MDTMPASDVDARHAAAASRVAAARLDVEARHDEYRAARARLADVLTDANDDGLPYRELADLCGWGHHYVGEIITAERQRREQADA